MHRGVIQKIYIEICAGGIETTMINEQKKTEFNLLSHLLIDTALFGSGDV